MVFNLGNISEMFYKNRLRLSFFCIFFASFVFLPPYTNGQVEDSTVYDLRVVHAHALDPLIKNSTVRIVNNYYYTGSIFGIKGLDSTNQIGTVQPIDTCVVETKNFDKLLFVWNFVNVITEEPVEKRAYFELDTNKPFTPQLSSRPLTRTATGESEMRVGIATLDKFLEGEPVYTILIDDDVDPQRIDAKPRDQFASRYVEIIKVDNPRKIHVRLKNRSEFVKNLTPDMERDLDNNREVKIPVGILVFDQAFPEDEKDYNIKIVKTRTK